MEFYVGTFSDKEKSIYRCKIEDNGKVDINEVITAGPKPSFIMFNADRGYLYSVNELDPISDLSYGSLVCLRKSQDGSYNYCKSLSTNGYYPCNISLSRDEKYLFVTNYASGTLCVYSLFQDGLLDRLVQVCAYEGQSIDPARQESSHPHGSINSLDGKYVYVTDLGADLIYTYSLHPNTSSPLELVAKVEAPKGSGPRHLAFSDEGDFLYVSGELADCVLVYNYDAQTGHISLTQNIPVFEGRDASSRELSNEIVFHKLASEISYYKGKVFLANRYTGEEEDTISMFSVKPDKSLQLINNVSCGGKTPRYFKIFPKSLPNSVDALVVVSLDTHNASVFALKDDSVEKLYTISDIPTPSSVQ